MESLEHTYQRLRRAQTRMGAFSYLAASVPARMANFGAAVALPILAIQQFDDVTIGGLLVAATLGPSVLAAPLAGVMLDRARRPGSVIAGAGLITATALATASLIGPIPLPVVLLTLVAAGAATPFYMGGCRASSSVWFPTFAERSRMTPFHTMPLP